MSWPSRSREGAHDLPECGQPCVALGPLPGGGAYYVTPGESGRVHVVDGPPQQFAIVHSSSGEVTPEHNENAEAAIRTITFPE
jgi:hypothetical protein